MTQRRGIYLFLLLRVLLALGAAGILWFYARGPALWIDRFDSPNGLGAEASGFGLLAIFATCLLGGALQILLAVRARTVYMTGAISLIQLVVLFRFIRRTAPVSLLGVTLQLPQPPFWYHLALLGLGLGLCAWESCLGPGAVRDFTRALFRRHGARLAFGGQLLVALGAAAAALLYLLGASGLESAFSYRRRYGQGFPVECFTLLALLAGALGLVLLVLTLTKGRTVYVTGGVALLQLTLLVLWIQLRDINALLTAFFPIWGSPSFYSWCHTALLILSLALTFHGYTARSASPVPNAPVKGQGRKGDLL